VTTLSDIAQILACPAPPPAEANKRVAGVASLAEAREDDLSFVGSEAYVDELPGTRALAVIVQSRVTLPPSWTRPAFRVDDAELAVAKVLERFALPIPQPPVGVDAAASVAPSAILGDRVAIGHHAFVGQRSRIGANTVLHPGAFVGDDVVIGSDCQIFPNVVIRERITIGNRVTIHAGSVLGTDGFGYRWDGSQHAKVPHIGTVIIEDDVEIGSCVCIDRAKFSATRVGRGTKIDNLVQIGHNAQIGPHCILVGQVGIAGSARLGIGVVLGGQTAVRDHITIGDGAMAAACSAIAEDVDPKTIVSGTPALPHRQSLREQAALRRLPDLVAQVRKLQEAVDELKKQQQ
jgi:UDP-3-O-[3-hydroxymyristoyl] glucosamine N-acyltransferase